MMDFMSRYGPLPDVRPFTVPPRVPQLERKKQAKQNAKEVGQLLPGIPNKITIDEIASKLPWTAFHILSLVSHSWQRAIQRHHIYDARVGSKSTQTLVALTYLASKDEDGNDVNGVALYSTEDGSCYRLPPILGVHGGIPEACGCVFLDGKLYILGGSRNTDHFHIDDPSDEVFVFDLAGQRPWEECRNMKQGRELFGCGVKDGKIYVFGGSGDLKPVRGSEVYDPKRNTWTKIKAMPSFGYRNNVTTVGDELFVHDGEIFHPSVFKRKFGELDNFFDHVGLATSAEVYHPLRKTWRTVKNFNRSCYDVVLMVRENLYKLSEEGIEVYDMDGGTWIDRQPIVLDVYAPGDSFTPSAATTVGDEILAIVGWSSENPKCSETCVIRSQGVGGKSKTIVWQKLQWSLDKSHRSQRFMCPIQL